MAEGEFQRAAQDLEQLTSRAGAVGTELARVQRRARPGRHRTGRRSNPALGEADAAQAEAERLRAEVEAQVGVSPELTTEARELRAAEEALRDADAEHRRADSEASRWRARAEMLALALEEAHAAVGGEEIADLDGVLGPLVDLSRSTKAARPRSRPRSATRSKAIVVDGDDAARAAVERLKRGDRQALLLVAEGRASGMQISFAPTGCHPLGASVRGLRPGLDAVLARLFAQFVLVDGGWEHALDVALANPGRRRGHPRRRSLRRSVRVAGRSRRARPW